MKKTGYIVLVTGALLLGTTSLIGQTSSAKPRSVTVRVRTIQDDLYYSRSKAKKQKAQEARGSVDFRRGAKEVKFVVPQDSVKI